MKPKGCGRRSGAAAAVVVVRRWSLGRFAGCKGFRMRFAGVEVCFVVGDNSAAAVEIVIDRSPFAEAGSRSVVAGIRSGNPSAAVEILLVGNIGC